MASSSIRVPFQLSPATIALALICCTQTLGQPVLNQPIIGTLAPSGSFGELRGNHFHSGIDYKTSGIEGLPVRAAEDGYISRIKVSSGGYGLAIYLTHPNGITTVYGHLSAFDGPIADTVERTQYQNQKFETELFLPQGRFPVKRGEIIGFSGNTGSSKGPHLHFETRHSSSEKPFNPIFTGIGYADTIPPTINTVWLYRPGPFGWLYGAAAEKASETELNTVSNRFFVGLDISDKANLSDNRLGVSRLELLLNSKTVLDLKIDSFSFDLTSQIRGMSDPERPGTLICLRMPGNDLPFFVTGNGFVEAPSSTESNFEIIVTDAAGNTARKTFRLYSGLVTQEPKLLPQDSEIKADQLFEPIPLTTTYGSKRMQRKLAIYPASAVFKRQQHFKIEKTRKLKTDLSKLVAVRFDKNGNMTKIAHTIQEGWVHIRTLSGGEFGLTTDTTPPIPGNATFAGYDLRGNLLYECQFSEDLSGLESVKATLNGVWVLSGFYTNRDVVFVVISPEKLKDQNYLNLVLTDACGNSSEVRLAIVNETEITRQ